MKTRKLRILVFRVNRFRFLSPAMSTYNLIYEVRACISFLFVSKSYAFEAYINSLGIPKHNFVFYRVDKSIFYSFDEIHFKSFIQKENTLNFIWFLSSSFYSLASVIENTYSEANMKIFRIKLWSNNQTKYSHVKKAINHKIANCYCVSLIILKEVIRMRPKS